MTEAAAPDQGVFDESAPTGRRWCQSPDHHEWLHMLLDRAKDDLSRSYQAQANLEDRLRRVVREELERRDRLAYEEIKRRERRVRQRAEAGHV